VTTRRTSGAAALAGGACLVAVYGLMQLLVFELRGVSTATVLASAIGGFLGFVSLALEIGMVERSARTFHAQGVQTTFLSFIMRLVVVAPLTLLFMKGSLGVDHEAFAISYCATFFLYLCWLTWATYHAPTCYRPKPKQGTATVVDRRPVVGSAR
jgi:hypothetical protein